MKKIIFTVTNDLSFDQRMQRICHSLATAGYSVLLVGRKKKDSPPINNTNFVQKRIYCKFNKGKLFYVEFNFRLFFFLLFKKADCHCAIDLDTILPCYLISKLKGTERVYDAHEYFSQLDEVISRPKVYKFWHWVERKMIPLFKNGYTVCQGLAEEFRKNYNASYEVIRNVPVLSHKETGVKKERVLLYQGAVNIGRGLEKLVEAMQQIQATLWVCGDGNFMQEMKASVRKYNVSEKVKFWGMLNPADLKIKTAASYVAINPFERKGLNQYLSLSNKFFDYIHSGIPQVTMNYPEYRKINQEFEIAVLIADLEPATIAGSVNKLFSDTELYTRLKNNCISAKENLNWQLEEKKLILFYHNLFNSE